ncbi:hypothetical protein CIHG_02898 [Coccidioides immitis H538.4]|uniref:BAG domain-containing protein n=1 Tax=Coccidioides immitis H538.4 TaxID=396776 RepID=A0A0J8RKE3_COCIT|nr:hypothetical protein CIHG_02898 [Coccidioides immitis H538.4]
MTSWRRSNVWRDVPSPFGAFFRAPQVRDEDFDYVGPEELGAGWRRPSFGRLDSMRDLGPQRAAGEHVVGLKQNSLIMCVVSEDFGSDDDSTSESEVGEFARYRTNYEREPRRRLSSPPGRRRRAQSKRKDARVDRHREDEGEAGPRSEPRISHSQPPRPRISPHIPHPTESKPSSPLSAPMSPALTPSSRMPTPSPTLNSSQTPREKLRILDDYVDKVLKPLIRQYIEQPPHDQKALEMEHKRLSETAMTQVLLKADGVELEGDGVARKQRKALILKVQSLLKSLDAAAKH